MCRLPLCGLLIAAISVIGACTQRVTRDDVTAARHKVNEERQELRDTQEAARDEIKTEAQKADDARREALKPATGLDGLTKPDPTAAEQRVIDAERRADDKIKAKAREVEDAERALAEKQAKFSADERRQELARTSNRMVADADRLISDLKTQSTAAPDDGALKTRIADLQTRRERVVTATRALSSATDANRASAEEEAAAAMADLERLLVVR